jgi:hypothetical protein
LNGIQFHHSTLPLERCTTSFLKIYTLEDKRLTLLIAEGRREDGKKRRRKEKKKVEKSENLA